MDAAKAEEALDALIRTVNATGGLGENEDGSCYPHGDPEWIDLADAYLTACAALDREPKIREDEDDD